jgi:ABC-type polysaccharide/polyol phosphate export permease
MVGIIEGFRAVLAEARAPDPTLIACSVLGILGVWLVAWPLFRYTSRYFADVL